VGDQGERTAAGLACCCLLVVVYTAILNLNP
jgi:hypothetical protein